MLEKFGVFRRGFKTPHLYFFDFHWIRYLTKVKTAHVGNRNESVLFFVIAGSSILCAY